MITFSYHILLCNYDRQLGFGRPDFDHFLFDVLSLRQCIHHHLLTDASTIMASILQILPLEYFIAWRMLLSITYLFDLGTLCYSCILYRRLYLLGYCSVGCKEGVGRCYQGHVNVDCTSSIGKLKVF